MQQWSDDEFAKTYFGAGQELLLSKCCNYPTFLHQLGNVEGKSLIDIGCGEGYFCRLVKSKGASRVLGIDISPLMIEAARSEGRATASCEFIQQDALKLGKIGEFDYATANFVLFYTETWNELAVMCRNIFENLKPGGRFVGTVINFYEDGIWEDTLEKYGLSYCNVLLPSKKKVKAVFTQGFEAVASWFTEEEYGRALQQAGFRSYSFIKAFVDEEFVKIYPNGFWDTYLEKPPQLCIFAEK